MHFDNMFRKDVAEMIDNIAQEIFEWNAPDPLSKNEIEALSEYVQVFDHCAKPDHPFLIGGSDGSGDFPCVSYGDAVAYLVTAMSRLYEASINKLVEKKTGLDRIIQMLWLSEDKDKSEEKYKEFFSRVIGESLETICQESDYFQLSRDKGCTLSQPQELIDNLVLPPAHEADNIGIQMRNTAEAGALIQLMQSLKASEIENKPVYILEDTTMALPLLPSKTALFFEIAKRYACKIARDKGIAFITLSKSHNMPRMDLIEEMVKQLNPSGEHWFLRLPTKQQNEDIPTFVGSRSIPPYGAVTYLFKFHRTTQTMRLDMDYYFWKQKIWNEDKEIMSRNEKQLFRDLDFASHDQRCYGYPYPIKACHDMASLTKEERVAFRKLVIDRMVMKGLRRKNFIDPSVQTGHA